MSKSLYIELNSELSEHKVLLNRIIEIHFYHAYCFITLLGRAIVYFANWQ